MNENTRECIYKFENGKCCRETITRQYQLKKEDYIRYYLSCDSHAQILKEDIEKQGFSVRLYTDNSKVNDDEKNIQAYAFSSKKK
jgi:hypothetical protein